MQFDDIDDFPPIDFSALDNDFEDNFEDDFNIENSKAPTPTSQQNQTTKQIDESNEDPPLLYHNQNSNDSNASNDEELDEDAPFFYHGPSTFTPLPPLKEPDLSMLNEEQKDAVLSKTQQTLILAGAGTGKTRVIIKRIEQIIFEGAAPNKIVVTTFTNKAAAELKHRLSASIGPRAFSIVCGTFHKISAQFLRLHHEAISLPSNFQLLNDDDQTRLVKRLLKTIDEDKEKSPRKILEQISQFKESGKKPYDKFFDLIYPLYADELARNNYLDYSDLIKNAILLFETAPELRATLAEHLLVDEYQDINSLQYRWIKLLGENKNLFCVGDEDQSIYGFRGANVEYIQKFHKDFPQAKIVQLTENYRSADAILKGATKLIAKNPRTFEKKLLAANKELTGHIRVSKVYNEFEEAALVARLVSDWKAKDASYKIGVLVRTNMQVHPIEHAFVESKIPYAVSSGKKFYMKKEIQDLLSYLRLLVNPNDFLAFSRALNTPKRNMGEARLNMLLDAMKSLDCSFENALTTLLPQLPKNAAEKCKVFLMQIQNWRILKNTMKPDLLAEKILQDIAYRIEEEFTKTAEEALENLKEHMKKAKSLEEFLENLEFLEGEVENNDIQIMTMHGAKGLEFDVVIAPGWEENVFPSPLSKDRSELEEERRLAYVTITRAKKFLEIIHTCNRRINGQYKYQMPSRFIFDL